MKRICIEPTCDVILTDGRRKCGRHRKMPKTTTTVLRPSTRGSNKRGVAAHKPDKSYTRRAKRQNTGSLGMTPTVSMTRWDRV